MIIVGSDEYRIWELLFALTCISNFLETSSEFPQSIVMTFGISDMFR